MSNNNNDLGAFLAGFVFGALVGAATAVILAPKSGPETRQQLIDASNELRQSAGTHSREYRDKASSLISDTRHRAQNLTEQVQDQVRIVLDQGKDQVEQVVENLNNGEVTDKG